MRRLFGRLSTPEFRRLYGHVGMWVLGEEPEGGARCVSSARRDLRGGSGATRFSTVTLSAGLSTTT